MKRDTSERDDPSPRLCPDVRGDLLLRLEFQRCRINTVTQASWLGAIIENMTQMSVAPGAQRLSANHTVAPVDLRFDLCVGDGTHEARPSTARVEFRVGCEELFPATDAAIHTRRHGHVVLAGEWTLCGLLPGDGILLRRQLLAPFTVALLDLVTHRGLPIHHNKDHPTYCPTVYRLAAAGHQHPRSRSVGTVRVTGRRDAAILRSHMLD